MMRVAGEFGKVTGDNKLKETNAMFLGTDYMQLLIDQFDSKKTQLSHEEFGAKLKESVVMLERKTVTGFIANPDSVQSRYGHKVSNTTFPSGYIVEASEAGADVGAGVSVDAENGKGLLIIRHGVSMHNYFSDKKIDGKKYHHYISDPALITESYLADELGIDNMSQFQKELETNRALARLEFRQGSNTVTIPTPKIIYVSPLRRTKETAMALFPKPDTPIEYRDTLPRETSTSTPYNTLKYEITDENPGVDEIDFDNRLLQPKETLIDIYKKIVTETTKTEDEVEVEAIKKKLQKNIIRTLLNKIEQHTSRGGARTSKSRRSTSRRPTSRRPTSRRSRSRRPTSRRSTSRRPTSRRRTRAREKVTAFQSP